MKAIWILLTILGGLGILMGCVMYGDIGIACFVCALSALLSGIGFAIGCRNIRSCGYLQPSDVQENGGLGEGKAKTSKKKFWYGCATVTSVVIVLFVCVATFSSGGGRRPSIEEASTAELAEEAKLGEQVLAWLKTAKELTSPQRSEEFSRFKGKSVIIQGKVEDVYAFSVVLNVGGTWFDEIKIDFDVLNSVKQEVKTLRKRQLVVMRGRITSQDDKYKLVCDNAEIVPKAKYKEVIGPSSVERMTSAEFSEAVELGEQMLAWLKTARELRGPQRSEALSRFEGKRIIMQGIVEEFNFSDIFDVVLKVGVEMEDRVKFEVANLALQETKTSCVGQSAVMCGRVTRRKESLGVSLVCDNAEIVPETKYRKR